MRRSFVSSGLVVAGLLASVSAEAQQPPVAEIAPLTPASTTPMPVPEELLRAHPGGLTADQVGQQAMATSFAAKQSLETMRAAEGRVDTAWAAFLPRLSGSARYTRLSPIAPPSLGAANVFTIGTTDPALGTPGHAPTAYPPGTALPNATTQPGNVFAVPNYSFPVFLDNTLLQATLTIPVSDYFLRIDQAYTAATRSAEAARFDVGAARATALSNGKVAYYTWLQARGAIVVAVQALNDQRIHLNDARNQFTVGNASKADVLRAETSVAQAELAVVTAENAAELAETQMRIAIHAPAGQRLVPGEGLDTSPAPFGGQLAPLVSEAVSQRFELKSIMANAASAKKTSEANKAARFPVISLFADGIEGNPNSRYFPPSQDFNFTWDVGAQATWAPNDILTANGGANDFAARARALEAQAQVTLEGIQVEVTQNYEALKNAEFSLESTRRELASATEAYRVARELFNNGRGTSTTLTDAERDLTVARIDALNAQVNARIQRVRLEHAAGRDLRGLAVAP